jgi:hypothetical protein
MRYRTGSGQRWSLVPPFFCQRRQSLYKWFFFYYFRQVGSPAVLPLKEARIQFFHCPLYLGNNSSGCRLRRWGTPL